MFTRAGYHHGVRLICYAAIASGRTWQKGALVRFTRSGECAWLVPALGKILWPHQVKTLNYFRLPVLYRRDLPQCSMNERPAEWT